MGIYSIFSKSATLNFSATNEKNKSIMWLSDFIHHSNIFDLVIKK